jgi:hypothetical protein
MNGFTVRTRTDGDALAAGLLDFIVRRIVTPPPLETAEKQRIQREAQERERRAQIVAIIRRFPAIDPTPLLDQIHGD